jgi:hypothetical protein
MASFRLSEDVSKFLETCGDKTATIEAAIRKSKDFKEWQQSQ